MPGIIEVRQDQAIGGASGLLSLLSVNRHSAPYQAAFLHHDLERACQSLDDRQQVATIFNAPMTLFTADEVAEMLEGQGYTVVAHDVKGRCAMTDHPWNEPQGEEPVTGMSPADQQAFVASMNTHGPYTLGPDSLPQDGVPRGALTQHRWERSTIYPDSGRDYWLYLPQQYDPAQPACLMVFQDGPLYLGPDVNAPAVFDNLIHQGAMPVTIGLFVTAGERGPGMPLWGGADNRSLEYDALGDRYARFLLDELLPEVEHEYRISADPDERAICGISSGGICAFTVAWERPDAFRKVVSHCGSFTNIRGGHQYPSLIRRAAPKPLRVFLQTGERDLDLVFGHWPLANREMAAALAYHGYDHQLVIGEGGHTLRHGGAIFPETLRWLWRDVRRRE